jgi:hypothetical protein
LQMVCRWSFYSKSLESFNQVSSTKFPLPSFLQALPPSSPNPSNGGLWGCSACPQN